MNGTPEQLFDAGMNAISGSAASRDYLGAIEYFRRSAQKDYGPAQVALAYFYDTGQIVAADPKQAADWYHKAAEQGDPLAHWLLGRLYFMGSGLSRDYLLRKSGSPRLPNKAIPSPHICSAEGCSNATTESPHWFHIAAEQGLPQAQYRYARALKEGYGIDRDRFEAYVWFLVALDAGYPTAQNDLGELDGLLSKDQVDQATAKARKLEDSVTRSVTAHGCTGWGWGILRNAQPATA